MNASSNVFVIDLVVRMVVPMRREFGRSLDVQQFMRDAAYAAEVLAQALDSHVPRLRDYARQVRRELAGPGAAEAARGARRQDASAKARTAAPGLGAEPFLLQRREAVRGLTDLAGPMAERLALRMERCADPAALRALLIEAGQLVAHLRGQKLAAAYLERCAPPPKA